MKVGILGLQGAVQDHITHLSRLGAEYVIVKDSSKLESIDRLILPGGESTVMKKFLKHFGMAPIIYDLCSNGMAIWGVCAGAILLAALVEGEPGVIGCADIHVKRNAYGGQVHSTMNGINVSELNREDFQAVFIRAPRIIETGESVSVLAQYDGDPVFIRQGRIMLTTFHPELTDDSCFHEYFLSM